MMLSSNFCIQFNARPDCNWLYGHQNDIVKTFEKPGQSKLSGVRYATYGWTVYVKH